MTHHDVIEDVCRLRGGLEERDDDGGLRRARARVCGWVHLKRSVREGRAHRKKLDNHGCSSGLVAARA